jgi:hypothetical protein
MTRKTFGRAHPAAHALVGTALLLAAPGASTAADPLQPSHPRRLVTGSAFVHGHLQVATGNEAAAKTYYSNTVAPQMNFMTGATILSSTIKDLLAYFGYPDINARDLHRLSSEQIMALSAEGDILATAFFAPKISRVSTPPLQPPEAFGWRKLVRLKAKAGSSADNNGMGSLYFLQNIFEKSATTLPAPENNVSLFNQAIATRELGSGPYSAAKRALYFFAFEPLVKCADAAGAAKRCEGSDVVPILVGGEFQDDGVLGTKLQATFDARNPETGAPGADFYYVPRSCEDCHGRSIAGGKVNFLDTDHWFDRVKPSYGLAAPKFGQEDFTALSQPILVDGGGDTSTAQFKKAFDVLRMLNAEIKAQNLDVDGASGVPNPGNFAFRAVSKWLDLHDAGLADATRHVPPYQRGFGSQPWDPQRENERTLLYYLNRYCYRCHSSIKYNVFERREVLRLKGDIMQRVTDLEDPKQWMPQDRELPGLDQTDGQATPTGDLKEFLDLLEQLQ